MKKLVFIGFGEAAFHISRGLRSEGFSDMAAFDIAAKTDDVVRQRAQEAGVPLLEAIGDAWRTGEFIVSLTSAKVALQVAQSVVTELSSGQVYVDMNSASPMTKRSISELPHDAEVKICDAAVMGTVPGNGHKVPMLLSGDGAEAFFDMFSRYGMSLTVMDAPAGSSSAIKMLKSIVMKGLAMLMFESFEAAGRYGVLDVLTQSLAESLEGKTVEKLADTFFARSVIHAERRSAELADVIETLDRVGVDASMSKATAGKLRLLAQKNRTCRIGAGNGDMPYKNVLELLK